MSIQIAAPLPSAAYDFFRMKSGPFKITCPTGNLVLERGDIFGVRPPEERRRPVHQRAER